MKQIKILMSAAPLVMSATLATFILTASPALAQHRGGHGGGSGGGHAVPRGSVGHFVGPGPQVVGVAPYRFYRPYYAFRPRVSLGFGFWAGYPLLYPYYGYYPYAYPYPAPYGYAPYGYAPYGYSPYGYPSSGYAPAYGYPAPYGYGYGSAAQPAPGSVGVQPGATASGGVSFEITPGTAAVFVDGTYVGKVEEFGPNSQPLMLTPGRHHVEIRAEGYQTMAFDTDVTAGQVLPYRGTLQPAR